MGLLQELSLATRLAPYGGAIQEAAALAEEIQGDPRVKEALEVVEKYISDPRLAKALETIKAVAAVVQGEGTGQ